MKLRWAPSQEEIQKIINNNVKNNNNNNNNSRNKIRILSQNTQVHYGDKYAPPNFEERLQSLVDQFINYDIILLQELISVRIIGMNVASYRYWMISKAQEQGFLFCADSRPNWFGIDNGCLILSRFPITECYSMDFSESAKYFSVKGAIKATIQIREEKQLDVFCLHMDPFSETVRKKQLQELMKYIPKSKDRECLIAGDFNILENTQETEDLKHVLGEFKCIISDWLDYIFVSPQMHASDAQVQKYTTSSGQPISDHNGVSVNLSL